LSFIAAEPARLQSEVLAAIPTLFSLAAARTLKIDVERVPLSDVESGGVALRKAAESYSRHKSEILFAELQMNCYDCITG
jgi:hypothetical protein